MAVVSYKNLGKLSYTALGTYPRDANCHSVEQAGSFEFDVEHTKKNALVCWSYRPQYLDKVRRQKFRTAPISDPLSRLTANLNIGHASFAIEQTLTLAAIATNAKEVEYGWW